YGAEISTNAANFYTNGLKGRFEETKIDDDHQLGSESYSVPDLDGDTMIQRAVLAVTALNERLRDDYAEDCAKGVERWNRIPRKAGIDYQLKLPHKCFHRAIGTFAMGTVSDVHVAPDGRIVSDAEWTRKSTDWLPSDSDHEHIQSLMKRVAAPGKMASWIAPPPRGINNQPQDFEYVKTN
ncbi:MAG: benzoyl-CoA 2,3-epoxidase subunit BoxB, partial [Rhodospirillales bacterium]|nr:benzoyl-CoA 2,3-epoxidase subunit BoxB [Rhodospirillales bacterium]